MIEHNGKKYARVTEILGGLNNFSHIDPAVLERKTNIGISVHKAIAEDIEGAFPTPCSGGDGYYKSYETWRDHLEVQFINSETRYYDHDLMISGQIDAVVLFKWSKELPVLVDFKTSAQESKEVWPMQAHMYNHLLSKNGVEVEPRFLFVKLDKEGSFPSVYSYNFDANIQAKCMVAVKDFWSSATK